MKGPVCPKSGLPVSECDSCWEQFLAEESAWEEFLDCCPSLTPFLVDNLVGEPY